MAHLSNAGARASTSNETMSQRTRSQRHDALLASYLLGLRHGASVVRDQIVADLDGFIDLGATRRAEDQLAVLRAFLTQFPEAERGGRAIEA